MCFEIVKFNRNNFSVVELKLVRPDSDNLEAFIKLNNVIPEPLKLDNRKLFEPGNEDPGNL